MQARKITKQEFLITVVTPVKMNDAMHRICVMVNTARFNSAVDNQKESK